MLCTGFSGWILFLKRVKTVQKNGMKTIGFLLRFRAGKSRWSLLSMEKAQFLIPVKSPVPAVWIFIVLNIMNSFNLTFSIFKCVLNKSSIFW